MLKKEIYIFIDLDGVLSTDMHKLYQTREHGDSSPDRWCPVATNNIYRLCKKYLAKIVVTTRFDKEITINQLKTLFEKNGVPGGFVAGFAGEELAAQENSFAEKGNKIKAWLDDNAAGNQTYLILDKDDDLLPEQWDHFIHVDPENGFADPNSMIEAVEILTNFSFNKGSDILDRLG